MIDNLVAASDPDPRTRFSTPGGIPASANISTIRTAVAGVSVAGLKTTVFLRRVRVRIFQQESHGKIPRWTQATTPNGCFIVYDKIRR